MIHRMKLLAIITMLFSLNACKVLEEISNADLGAIAQNVKPSSGETSNAIKQALNKGVTTAINLLGKQDGFNTNDLVRIALPKDLQKVDKLLRKVGQEKYADQFVTTLNRAAEKAVPQAADIFSSAIQKMSITDVINIMKGSETAATDYFKRTSQAELTNRFLPIVKNATGSAGVTKNYKKMIGKLGPLNSFLGQSSIDLDSYVTQKATDGLFLYVAEQEKKIRENPIERTTDLLRRVFDYYQKS